MKVIDLEVLKDVLKGVIPEDNSEIIEHIMSKSFDHDEPTVQDQIDAAVKEAVEAANKQAKVDYAKQLHDMFFNGTKPEAKEGELQGEALRGNIEEQQPVDDIFQTVENN